MAAQAAPDMSQYITRTEAQNEIGRLAKEQLEAFTEQRKDTETQGQEARDTVIPLTNDFDNNQKRNKADCEKQIADQVGELRTQAQTSVTTVNEKIAEIESLFKSHTASQEDADLKLSQHVADMTELAKKLLAFAGTVEANLFNIQQEVSRTQGEVSRTQAGIQNLIETARSEGGTALRPIQERDRQVFDPRDYKIEALPNSIPLGVWKKLRREVEIYVDTIGPTWKGVKLILQQARHSPTALQTTDSQTLKEAFRLTVGRARAANNGVEPVEELSDYSAKASVLHRMLVLKLNLDLSTEFRNSSPDGGFELWRLLNRKLDPPRAD